MMKKFALTNSRAVSIRRMAALATGGAARLESSVLLVLVLVLSLVLGACSDNDSFTTSPSHMLTFSTDTISLDTVFSRIPTATRTFWVYNRSGDGLRCASVRLERGNQTGFRVNVDGIYLGSSQGFQTNEVEIRDKDSIRVFVELTSNANNAETPQLLEDNLVFTLESGVEQKVNLRGYTWDADIYGLLEIKSDTIISSTKPIVIQQGLRVDSGATLTVGAGTTLYFSQQAGADVYGRLVAEGTPGNDVVFRGDRIDRMFDYLPYDRVPGQWQGIRFHASSFDNSLNYTDIHSAYDGIVCDSSDTGRLKLKAANTTIHNCQGYGVTATSCMTDFYNCQITNTLRDCAAFYGGSATLRYCTIAQFYPFDSDRGSALYFANQSGTEPMPLARFDVVNSLITGYADDVVTGSINPDAGAAYSFAYCILRTVRPDTTQAAHFSNVAFEDIEDTAAITSTRHFRDINASRQYYDFHLDSLSTAIDSALVIDGYGATDRDGRQRDARPDIGCYEYVGEE